MRRLLLLLIPLLIAAVGYLLLQRGGEWTLQIYVDGEKAEAYTLKELEELSTPLPLPEGGEVYAVPLLTLLRSSGVDLDRRLIEAFTPKGADGYQRRVERGYLHLHEAYIQLVEGEAAAEYGPLRIIVADLPRKYWVHHLIRIDLTLGEWRLDLLLEGEVERSWGLEVLSAKPRVSLTLGEEVIEAVSLSSLLEEAGVELREGLEVVALSLDGGGLTLNLESLPEAYVEVVDEPLIPQRGRLRLIVLGEETLHHLIALEVSG